MGCVSEDRREKNIFSDVILDGHCAIRARNLTGEFSPGGGNRGRVDVFAASKSDAVNVTKSIPWSPCTTFNCLR